MSAFQVSDAHIHALVTVALEGPRGPQGLPVRWHRLSWYAAPVDVTTTLVQAQALHREARREQADAIGQMLVNANARSLHARYGDEDAPAPYRYRALPLHKRPTAVECLKLCHCLDYQCNESATWATSEARQFLDVLEGALVRSLPGYSEAVWEWTTE